MSFKAASIKLGSFLSSPLNICISRVSSIGQMLRKSWFKDFGLNRKINIRMQNIILTFLEIQNITNIRRAGCCESACFMTSDTFSNSWLNLYSNSSTSLNTYFYPEYIMKQILEKLSNLLFESGSLVKNSLVKVLIWFKYSENISFLEFFIVKLIICFQNYSILRLHIKNSYKISCYILYLYIAVKMNHNLFLKIIDDQSLTYKTKKKLRCVFYNNQIKFRSRIIINFFWKIVNIGSINSLILLEILSYFSE